MGVGLKENKDHSTMKLNPISLVRSFCIRCNILSSVWVFKIGTSGLWSVFHADELSHDLLAGSLTRPS